MRKLTAVGVALTFLLLGSRAPAAQTSRPYPLYRVNVSGAARLPAATVVRMTGLKTGTEVTTLDVERARQRLLDTGLFSSVGYRFSMAGHSLIVSFDVEEPPWGSRILFDNFVWFTDDELVAAVARELPTFAGYAPAMPRSLLRISRALEQALARAGIAGTIGYVVVPDAGGANMYRYRAELAAPMPTCAIAFEGVSPAFEPEISERMRFLVGQDYSRDFIGRGVAANLLPFYRERGYAKAEMTSMRGTLAAAGDAACPGGVRVTLAMREGLSYTFGGAAWAGIGDADVAGLNARLGLAAGDVLNMTVLDAGLLAVRDPWVQQGHIAARATPVFSFDDATRMATASILVTVGPRVRMGSLEIAGLPADRAERVRDLWTLAEGATFDGLYARAFGKLVKDRFPSVAREFPNLDVRIVPVSGTDLVNVTLTFARR